MMKIEKKILWKNQRKSLRFATPGKHVFFMFSAFGLQITMDNNNKINMGTQATFFQILRISKFCRI